MLWRKGRRSDNVVEAGRAGRRFTGGHKLGLLGVIIIAIIGIKYPQTASLLMRVMDGGSGAGAPQQTATAPAANTPQNEFVRHVLGSTEDVWTAYFQRIGRQYVAPKLTLFRGGVRTACGAASTVVGPFYCPGDQHVYLDLTFFDQMHSQLHASTADFARAYVIAHEVGHHVQDLLGIFDKVQQARRRGAEMNGASGLSVRQELPADCSAGVWANRSQRRPQGGLLQVSFCSALGSVRGLGAARSRAFAGRSLA